MGIDITKKPLPISESFFDSMIESGYYYVDKTLFIKDILDKKAKVILCTRPRRFGKTLNQTMLKCFFEDTTLAGNGKDTRALFRGLKIEAAGERYMEHQGRYPVVFLSFKEAKRATFEDSYGKLRECIAREFERHAYAAEKIVSNYDRDLFNKLSDRTGSIGDYSEYFGFTQDEMDALLQYYGLEDQMQLVRDWYNGYLFGDTEVYNPWSSVFVVDNWRVDVNEYPKPYWVNTSATILFVI